jgi:predicted DNA-binding transcriptional regulator AlpA
MEELANTEVKLLTSKDLSARLGVSVATLNQWRNKGRGPSYVKLTAGKGGPVRYALSDVRLWESSLAKVTCNVDQRAAAGL